MSKHRKGRASASRKAGRKRGKVWYGVFAGIVLAGLTFAYVGTDRESSPGTEQEPESQSQTASLATSPSLKNRLVLPAWPQNRRPRTLSPNSFSDPEVARSYQVAQEIPEVLEHMPCYCGCYGTSGHRNNLDCFADNHGATWSLCRLIALEAQHQHRLGTPISQIKRIVDQKWAPLAR